MAGQDRRIPIEPEKQCLAAMFDEPVLAPQGMGGNHGGHF
jgi:hypothetical protein